MKLFSEKVKFTLTNSSFNILQVEVFEEIFFGVYEIEINKSKYPVEVVSEYNGNPVVSVPVEVKGEKKHYPFILIQGNPEVIFNEENTMDKIVNDFEELPKILVEDKTVDIPIVYEESINIPDLVDKKKQILEQIEQAKKEAAVYSERIKKQKLKESTLEINSKKKALDIMLTNARSSLVSEFLSISEKIKNEFITENDDRFFEIKDTIDNKIQDMSDSLLESLKNDFSNSEKQFDSKIKELIKELYESLQPKIDNELKEIATEIVEKVDSIEKNLDEKLRNKADKTLIENVEGELNSIASANVELNDKINKGINKALSRVGNIDKRVDDLTIAISEEVNTRIDEAESYITTYYKERLDLLENKTFDLNELTRKYFIELITESRNNLIDEVRKIKNEKPIEYIVESKGKKQSINSDDLIKDFDKKITSKIDSEVTRLRKYIAVYSGGGSVAMQFADGGTMNGNLSITGSVEVDKIIFDQTPESTGGVGQLIWNDTDGTLDLGLKGGNVTLQLGQEQVLRVVNKTGEDLLESQYKAVRITGATGQRLSIQLAQASNDINSTTTIGIVTETILKNQEGFITTMGQIHEINTTGSLQGETWVDGDVLYLSPTIAGGITKVKPIAPDHVVLLGYVEYAHNVHGKMYVKVLDGFKIEELHNVRISSVQNNDTLKYNAISGLWINGPSGGGGDYLPLSGGTITDSLIITNGLSASRIYTTQLDALSANITILDIKQYELSGFNVTGDCTIQGGVSASGALYGSNLIYNMGNTNDENVTIGTNDNYNLNLETAGVSRMSILSSGDINIGGNTTITSGVLTVSANIVANTTLANFIVNGTNGLLVGRRSDGGGSVVSINNSVIFVNQSMSHSGTNNAINLNNSGVSISTGSSNQPIILSPNGTGTIDGRNGLNSQEFRLYNTYTSATSAERATFKFVNNNFVIGAETLPLSGSQRSMLFQTASATRMTILSSGEVRISSSNSANALNVVGGATFGNNISVPSVIVSGNGGALNFGTAGATPRGQIRATGDGVFILLNSAQLDFNRLQFGGSTSEFPAIKRSGTSLEVKLADDSTYTNLNVGSLSSTGNINATGSLISNGKPAVVSNNISEISQITQAAYNSLTPSISTFYIITDADQYGPISFPIKAVNSNYSILEQDYTLKVTATAILNLPTAIGCGGRLYNIKSVTTGSVTLSAAAGEFIDGLSSVVSTTQYESFTIQSDGVGWLIL
jgi:hypothetical protein